MARKHKGNRVDGWVVIDKPAGVTSIKAVSKARWAYQAGKAGHGGTLDPLATGVLAVAFGEATKTVAIAQEGLKTYRFTIRLGQATTTDDAEGEVIAESELRPSDAEIAAALPAYEGEIEQVPPQFSAVKVAGERARPRRAAAACREFAARRPAGPRPRRAGARLRQGWLCACDRPRSGARLEMPRPCDHLAQDGERAFHPWGCNFL
jgi:tRNA pseudouridine55 synthase